jgi:tyrosyl-tRNA synthetase
MTTTFPANSIIPDGARVKFGIDPTFPRLHLGHLVPLRVVKKFIIKGNPVVIVLGTFTAQLGDPSGKDATRPILTKEEVKDNALTIMNQVRLIMPQGFVFWENGELHNTMELPVFMREAAHFTVNHMMSRDAFQKRQENSQPIGLHELLVPICQGLDSVHQKTEVEIGGQDQLFNFQVTRSLQEKHGQKPQICLMCPIIRGTDGQKMSKSLNNCIWLDEEPNEMFGKVMSIPDDVMEEWTPLFRDFASHGTLGTGHPNPMQEKLKLAHTIVEQCHDKTKADDAWSHFQKTVQNKEIPENIEEIKSATLLDAVTKIRKCSKSEARRLLLQKGVSVDGVATIEDIEVKPGQIIKIGSRTFGKIVL